MSIANHQRHSGFTLIEMIMVITITGIIAGMVAVFIRAPVEGYVDSVRRAELTDQADVALRRMARDVRLALPNSLREVDPNQSFEFIMTKSGGRYRDESDGSSGSGLNYLFSSTGSFDVLGTPLPAMAGGDFIVVYNLGAGYTPADAYAGGNVAVVGGTGVVTTSPVALSSNPFPTQTPRLPSPNARFQVVDAQEQVVRYVCDGTSLQRQICTMNPLNCTTPGATLAGGGTTTATCTIDYHSAANGRSGMLYINLTLQDASGEQVTLFNQIHVDNSP